jgi:hypothetical protein
MSNFLVPPCRPLIPALPIKQRTQVGIRFLDFTFTEPAPFDTALKPQHGGLYVVLIYDSSWHPRSYRPIYFGKSRNLSERLSSSHEKHSSWIRVSAGHPLYVAFCRFDSALLRTATERRLISHYKTVCNDVFNSAFTTLNTLSGLRPPRIATY